VSGRSLPWRRGALTQFVKDHEVPWEVALAVLTAVYIALSFAEDASNFEINPTTAALVGLSAVFLLEFSLRCWDAASRHRYLREHWLDLVTSFPLVGPFRALRLLRLLRFFRLGLGIRKLVLGSGRLNNSWLVWPFLLVFWTASAYGLWVTEHGANPLVHNFNDSLMYAFLTAATVGYGGFTPITFEGKLVAGAIVFVAIGLIGFTSARVTAMYLDQRDSEAPAQLKAIERDLAAIKSDLARLVGRDEVPRIEVVQEEAARR
jgi:voltage-gated potassium channel